MFEGVRGRSYQGDIALDDIMVKCGECVLPGMFDINVRRVRNRNSSANSNSLVQESALVTLDE